MWLVPAFSAVANAAVRIFYRITITGERVPQNGPVLLVANHPNSLLDPLVVCAAARRPVHFLAKATLFDDPKLGWVLRGVGAIPVYRRVDDPALMERNVQTFAAARAALGNGSAVGIFPEGTSHSAPAMTTLRTGAARIALGSYAEHRRPFPIVPVGLVFRQKDIFRSSALAVVGQAIAWEDLAERGEADQEAVADLTERIGAALKRVTLNLESWEDQPLVDCAQRIWEAEHGAEPSAAARLERMEITTRLLADVRSSGRREWVDLMRDVRAHCRRLARLRVTPRALAISPSLSAGLRWAIVRVTLAGPPAVALAVAGLALFWPPYRATQLLVRSLNLPEDQRSSGKLLVGLITYTAWVSLLAAGAALAWGRWAGLATFISVPLVGITGMLIRERWRGAWSDAMRFFRLRSRRSLVNDLRRDQTELAARLSGLYTKWSRSP